MKKAIMLLFMLLSFIVYISCDISTVDNDTTQIETDDNSGETGGDDSDETDDDDSDETGDDDSDETDDDDSDETDDDDSDETGDDDPDETGDDDSDETGDDDSDETDDDTGDTCEDGKPQKFTMRYIGGECITGSNSQTEGKYTCEGEGPTQGTVYIEVKDKKEKEVMFSGNVTLNATIEIKRPNNQKLPAETRIFIYENQNGDLKQKIVFHSSCSQPLNVGDQFGSLILEHMVVIPK